MTFTPRDVKDVSALVSKKLEFYMNHERREDRFDTQGRYRTTPKMETLDLMCHMLDKADLKRNETRCSKSGSPHRDSRSRKSKKRIKSTPNDESSTDARNGYEENKSTSAKQSKEKKEKRPMISPCLIHNSRRVVPVGEAERLKQNANKILEEQDLDKLHVIHRYRPHSPDIAAITENGKVANYSLHVGSALHSKNYVDYYLKEGLQSSKKEYAKRLQRLQAKQERESHHGRKGYSEASSSAAQNHKSIPLLRMQEILSPCQSLDSLSSSRSPTPRKLNPLTLEQPAYNTFTNLESQSSRGSSEKQSKAASNLYKAKRYASGYGYRIISEDGNNVGSPKYQNVERESRADIASSEEYCKFTGSPADLHESGREDFGSEVNSKKVFELTDVEMEYNKYKSSIDSVSIFKEKESVDTRAQSHNESFISGSHLSDRSTMSKFSPQSKDLDRSFRSSQSLVSGQSGTYRTQESDLYNSTQSEQNLDTARSTSLLSSTPRRPRVKNVKREPIQTIINPPEVPRLGIPSDVNETTERASSVTSSALEEYVTAEEKALKHPDARALEERINSSQMRARDKTLDDDTRAERSIQKYLGSDEIPVEQAIETSLPPLNHDIVVNANQCERNENIQVPKANENSCQQENDSESKEQLNETADGHEISMVYEGSVIDCKHNSSLSKGTKSRRRANELEGTEVERGEDELKNMELHRGEVPTLEKDKSKLKPERGDDTPRTMAIKGRLTKSAKRRGVSNYYTMGDEERGLEKEYFEPLTEHEKEEYIPSIEPENGSELNTPASSRPSSAASTLSEGTLQSGEGRRKAKPKTLTGDSICKEKGNGEQSRPQSALNKSVDGRGDDSNSVKNHSCSKPKSDEKETKEFKNDEELGDEEKTSKSTYSQSSFREDDQNYRMQVSSGSRGSFTTKERLGTGKGYSIEGEMLARGQDENHDRKIHDSVKEKSEKEQEYNQNLPTVKDGSIEKKLSLNEQLVTENNEKEADFEKLTKESLKAGSQIQEGVKENQEQIGDEKSTINNITVKDQSQKNQNISIESSNLIKNDANQIIERNVSPECLNKSVTEESSAAEKDIFTPEQGTTSVVKQSSNSVNQDLPLEEKAFIETYSDENEVIKEAVNTSASLVISDGDTVIDFRPLSASTALSVSNDHDPDRKRMSVPQPQPSKIVEVTEIDSNMGSGRETHRVNQDAPIPHPAERKHLKNKDSKMHIVNIADVKIESYDHIKEHPAMKRSTSDYFSTENQKAKDYSSQKNISLPLDQDKDRYISGSAILSNKEEGEADKMMTADTKHNLQMKEEMPEEKVTSCDSEIMKEENLNEAITSQPKEEEPKFESELEHFGREKRFFTAGEGQNGSRSGKDNVTEKCSSEKLRYESGTEQDKLIVRSKSEQEHVGDQNASKREKNGIEQRSMIEKGISQQVIVTGNNTRQQEKCFEKSVSQRDNAVEKHSMLQIKAIEESTSLRKEDFEKRTSEQDILFGISKSEQDKAIEKISSEQVKVVDNSTSEQDKVIEISASEQGKGIERKFKEQSNDNHKSTLEQDRVIEESELEQMKIIEKNASEQDGVLEKSASEKVEIIEKSTSEQDGIVEKSASEKEKVIGKNASEQDGIIEKSASEKEKVIEKIASEQDEVIEKSALEKVEIIEKSASEQDGIIEKSASEKEKVIEKIASEQDEVIEKSASEKEKVIEKIASEQDEVIEKSASEKEKVIEKRASEQGKVIEENGPEPNKTIEKRISEQNNVIENSTPEQDTVFETLTSEQDKVIEKNTQEHDEYIEKNPPKPDRMIKNDASVHDNVIEKSKLEQDQVIENIISEQDKVVEKSAKEQDKLIEEMPSEQIKVSVESGSMANKIVEKSESMQDNFIEKSALEQDQVIESITSRQDKLIEIGVEEEGKGFENGTSEKDEVVEKSAKEQDKVFGEFTSKQNNVIDDNQPSSGKMIEKNESTQDKDKSTNKIISKEDKVIKMSASEQDKVVEQNAGDKGFEKITDDTVEKNASESYKIVEKSSSKLDLDNIVKKSAEEHDKVIEKIPQEEEDKVFEKSASVHNNIIDKIAVEKGKAIEESESEQRKVFEESSSEHDKVIEISISKPDKVIENSESGLDKIIEESAPEADKSISKLELRKDGIQREGNVTEISKQEKVEFKNEKDQDVIVENVLLAETETLSNQNSVEPQKIVKQPQLDLDAERVTEQLPLEPGQLSEQNLSEKQEEVYQQTGPEKQTQQGLLQPESIFGETQGKQRKGTAQSSFEHESLAEACSIEKEAAAKQFSTERQTIDELPANKEGQLTTKSPDHQDYDLAKAQLEQDKAVEESLFKNAIFEENKEIKLEKVADQSPVDVQEVTKQSPSESEKEEGQFLLVNKLLDKELPPTGQEATTNEPVLECEKITEQSLSQGEKGADQCLFKQENISDSVEQEKLTKQSPSVQKEVTEQTSS